MTHATAAEHRIPVDRCESCGKIRPLPYESAEPDATRMVCVECTTEEPFSDLFADNGDTSIRNRDTDEIVGWVRSHSPIVDSTGRDTGRYAATVLIGSTMTTAVIWGSGRVTLDLDAYDLARIESEDETR